MMAPPARDWLDPLRRALDASPAPATFFFRDDDVGWSDDRLFSLLDLFARKGVRGTFFVMGWVGRRFPKLVRDIAAGGHEIGCHSFWHRLIYELTPEEFRRRNFIKQGETTATSQTIREEVDMEGLLNRAFELSD